MLIISNTGNGIPRSHSKKYGPALPFSSFSFIASPLTLGLYFLSIARGGFGFTIDVSSKKPQRKI